MKIAISYPVLESKKGIPLLSQNRQFQWFNSPTYIFPIIPAYAATLLKNNGYKVMWDDGIAEELTYHQWKERIIKEKPDIIAIETKTPVVEMHWKIINDLKNSEFGIRNSKFVLYGDHATALPQESLEKSKVDYVIQSGDYDFMLLNLANHLSKGEPLEGGIWFRGENGEIKNSGESDLSKHNLDDLPMIDRELTKWKNYAYKNGNFKHTPGAYMMSGRDCWWGRCAFCVTEDAQVATINGSKKIKEIIKNDLVLTHLGNYKKVNDILKRQYKGKIIEIKANYLLPFRITPEHKVLSLANENVEKCKESGNTGYICKNNNDFSKRLDCKNCSKDKPYKNYRPVYVEAGNVKKGDFLAIPINREILNKKDIDLAEILNLSPVIVKTTKKIREDVIAKILEFHLNKKSERNISAQLNIDRETVHRYIILEKEGLLDEKSNPLKENNGKIKFFGGKNWTLSKIKLNNDIFRLFGYYLAEGCVSKLKNRPNSFVLSFTFNQKERSYIDDVANIIEKNFKIKANLHINKVNHTCQITVGSSLLAKAFKNLFGENCYNKNVPEFILKAAINNQKELISGIFRGDGHYRERVGRREYILSTASDNLSSQVVAMLLRCGAIPSVRKTKLRKKMTKMQNVISLSTVDIINVFGDNVKINGSKESIYKKGFIVENYAYVPVLNIKNENYSGEVYNLSVDKDHSYTVNFAGVSNCSWTTLFPGKNFRTRSAKNALDEVGHLIELGVKEIMEDSGSLPIGQWLLDFCNGMIARGYNKKIVMSCNMRITGIKKLETWKLMKKAGFRFILFGLESANQETLDKICKNLKAEEIEPGLKLCKNGGLEPHITAMIGYPWETKEMAQKTIDLAKKLFSLGYVDTLQGTIVTPYPGTPLFKECQEKGWLVTTDYSRFDQRGQVMKSPLSDAEAKELVQGLYKSFMTPKFILKKILAIRTFNDVKYIFTGGLKVLGHLTDFSKK